MAPGLSSPQTASKRSGKPLKTPRFARLGDDLHGHYLDVHQGPVVAVRLRLLDVLHHVHALQHAAEDRVLAVQPGARDRSDLGT